MKKSRSKNRPASRARESLSIKAPLEARQADVVRTGGCHWHVHDVLWIDEDIQIKLADDVEDL